MATEGPTFHHLNNSQSQRILWLLEELQIPYNLQLYERHTSGNKRDRAPDSLKKIHQLGKSPILQTTDGRTLVESSAIALYLIKTYDTTGKFQGSAATGNDEIRDQMLVSFGDASLSVVMNIEMIFEIVAKSSPFFIRWLFNGLHGQIQKMFTRAEFEKDFKFLEDTLGQQEYFMGSDPGRADFCLSWPFDFCIQRKYVDLKQYPRLNQWYERIHARDAWKRSLEKGNGYDMSNVG